MINFIALIAGIIISMGSIGAYQHFNADNETLGAFGDPFLSVQLAASPQNNYILSTDGTNNSWIVNTGGSGSGGSSLWQYTASTDKLEPIRASTSQFARVTADSFQATSTATSSTFSLASITRLTNLTSNGFVKTGSGNGTLSIDTTTYESGLTAGDGLTRTVNDFDCDTASGTVFGCLSAANWTTFNNKQDTITAGDALTLTGTDIDFDGGTTPGGELGGTWASPTVDAEITTLEELSDVGTFTQATGNVIYWDGDSWENTATTSWDTNTTYTAGDALTLTGTDIDFDGGTVPAGDLGGTWASPSVTDDSHAHTGTSLSGIDISDDTNLTAGNLLTLVGDTIGSIALATTSIDTCADFASLITGETGSCGSVVFSVSPTLTGTLTYNNATGSLSTTTAATTTDFAITDSLNFGGVVGTAWTDFCTTITGSAALCDGNDASGGGGTGSNWSNFSGFITPSTTVGITVNSSSSITDLSVNRSTTSKATTTDFFSTRSILTLATATDMFSTRAIFGGATTTNLHISSSLNFGGVAGTAWSDFCSSITGGAGLCDGTDADTTYTAGDALTLTGNDFDFDGGATPAGDLGGTWASPSVTDDSHAHTGTTLSGIDLSDDVNLTAGDALTLTGDDIDFDGGTAPSGELGGTWGSITIDDSVGVSGWNLTTPTLTTSMTTTDNTWLGFGSGAGRVEFDDLSQDEVLVLNAFMGVATDTPTSVLSVQGTSGNTAPIFSVASSSLQTFFSVLHTGTTTISGPAAATSSAYFYSTSAGKGGSIILEDNDGAGCSEIFVLNGTVSGRTVTCPVEI